MKPRISQLVKGPFVYYIPEGGGGFGGGGGGTIFEKGEGGRNFKTQD